MATPSGSEEDLGGSGKIGGISLGYTSDGQGFDVATTNKYVADRSC